MSISRQVGAMSLERFGMFEVLFCREKAAKNTYGIKKSLKS